MSDAEPVPLGRRIRYGARVHRAVLSGLVLGIGAFLSLLATGYFTPLSSSFPFTVINPVTDSGGANYNLVFVFLGPIIAIVGAVLVGGYMVARRKFEHLMLTKSKAEFLRNIPDLEQLLWDLTPADEQRYEEKRAELRLRR
ncbi:MAG TPA: DUF3198 domain-containing protein [Thermoplasmata archaeon]|nr:DUF3198 domain-containing protein [Thermoplasmata archaeon]